MNFTLVIICCCRSLSPQVPHTYHNPTLMASPYSTLPRRPTSSSSGASSANRGQPQQPHHDLRGCPPPIMASAVGRNSPLLELTGMYLLLWHNSCFFVRILSTHKILKFLTLSDHLGMNYYVNFFGRLGSNGFQLGTHGNWKNQNPGAFLELPAKQHCQFSLFT